MKKRSLNFVARCCYLHVTQPSLLSQFPVIRISVLCEPFLPMYSAALTHSQSPLYIYIFFFFPAQLSTLHFQQPTHIMTNSKKKKNRIDTNGSAQTQDYTQTQTLGTVRKEHPSALNTQL